MAEVPTPSLSTFSTMLWPSSSKPPASSDHTSNFLHTPSFLHASSTAANPRAPLIPSVDPKPPSSFPKLPQHARDSQHHRIRFTMLTLREPHLNLILELLARRRASSSNWKSYSYTFLHTPRQVLELPLWFLKLRGQFYGFHLQVSGSGTATMVFRGQSSEVHRHGKPNRYISVLSYSPTAGAKVWKN